MADASAIPYVEQNSVEGRSKLRNLIETIVSYGLILLVIWTPRAWQRYLWWLAAAAVLTIVCISFDGLRTMGLRMGNFFRSLWIVGVALLVAGAAVLVAARLHTLHLPRSLFAFVATYCAYAVWSGVQQLLLQGVFLQRILGVIPDTTRAALTASVLFAAAHLPSAILTPLTLIWGFAACLIFLRYRNLYSLALAHAILGIAVAVTVPGPVDHNMRVGLGYLTYNPHRYGDHPYPVSHPLPKP
jgi:Type II CAAX prenyl endopeptidase Rce1-like